MRFHDAAAYRGIAIQSQAGFASLVLRITYYVLRITYHEATAQFVAAPAS
jgi:hypothetical protein